MTDLEHAVIDCVRLPATPPTTDTRQRKMPWSIHLAALFGRSRIETKQAPDLVWSIALARDGEPHNS
jgi:hypothetical protein